MEVNSDEDIFEIHDHVDNIERATKEKYNVSLVLHMDPVKVNDPETDYYRKVLKNALEECNENWHFHDFRIVSGPTHTNLVFDLVIPFEDKRTKQEIEEEILAHMHVDKIIYLVITIDHPFA